MAAEQRKTPSITVVIPAHRAQYLAAALESVLRQDLPPTQVMLIDDGSPDDVRSIAERFGPPAEYYRGSKGGKPSSLNFAAGLVRGDYVYLLDDDDLVAAEAFSSMASVLEAQPELHFVYGSFASFRDGEDEIAGARLRPAPDPANPELLLDAIEANPFGSCSFLYRADVFRSLTPFEEDVYACEDFYRHVALLRRYHGGRVPRVVYYHRWHPTAITARFPLQFRKDSQRLVLRLRAEWDLRQYCMPHAAESEFHGVAKRRAYLRRMAITASQALYPEMLEDLQGALAAEPEAPLTAAEKERLWNVVGYGWTGDPLLVENGCVRRINQLCSGTPAGQQVRAELLRSFAWRALREWREHKKRSALTVAATGMRLLNPAIALSLLRSKLVRRRTVVAHAH